MQNTIERKKCLTTECENLTTEGKCVKCRSPKVTQSTFRKCANCDNRVRKNDLCTTCMRIEKKLKPCTFPGCNRKTKDDICSTCKIKSLSKAGKEILEQHQKSQISQPGDNIYNPHVHVPIEQSFEPSTDESEDSFDYESFIIGLDKLFKYHDVESRKVNLIKKLVHTIMNDY